MNKSFSFNLRYNNQSNSVALIFTLLQANTFFFLTWYCYSYTHSVDIYPLLPNKETEFNNKNKNKNSYLKIMIVNDLR